jgi:hypothetical protein
MKPFDEEIEKELGRLRPVAPSDALKAKLERALEEPPSTPFKSLYRLWPLIGLATAAGLIVVAIFIPKTSDDLKSGSTVNLEEPSQDSALNTFEPMRAEQRLMEAFDDGIVFTAGHDAVRKLRYQFVDTLTMVDNNDGSVFTMEIPREEILFVPVTLL